MLLKGIETAVPEPLVRMNPNGDLGEGFAAKRNEDFPSVLLSLNQPSPF
jgi:hypothetical protein